MQSLLPLFEFIDFTHKFQQVKRTILATGEDRDENDAEHSYQLALVAWYLIRSRGFKLNIDKVLQYSLVHDLVEVYAGDTYFHTANPVLKDSKQQREQAAAEKITTQFAEFSDLREIIDRYEQRADPEAAFVYALDKILPVINIYLDQGKSWQRDRVTYEMARTKDAKVAISPEAQQIWQELIPILDQHKHLFYQQAA